jgi:predicted MFS family arabinose efflux permease
MAGLAALVLAYVLSQFFRVFLAVLAPELSATLGMDARMLGWASAAWFIAFAGVQIPVGLGLDRLGPRRTAGWMTMLGVGGGAMAFSAAQGPAGVIAAMALIGAGCGPALMASMFIFARRFPPARFAALSSGLIGVATLGNAGAAAPLAMAADAFGWRAALAGLGAVAALTGAAILWRLQDPADPAAAPRDDDGPRGYLTLLAMPHMWPIYLMMMVNYAPAVGVRGLWAGPYLAQMHGLDAAGIGAVTLWMAIAMAAGSFVYAPLDGLLRTRKWVVFTGTAVTAAACAAIAWDPGAGAQRAAALLALVGFAGVSFGVIMAHARPFFPPALTGRGVTLMNFFCMVGVGALQATGGALARAAETPQAAWSAVFGLYAAAAAAGCAVYLFSRDSRG